MNDTDIEYEYVKLADKKNQGTIVRCNGRLQYKYDKDRGWVRSGIFMRYVFEESPEYNMYEEITEEEAMKLISAM